MYKLNLFCLYGLKVKSHLLGVCSTNNHLCFETDDSTNDLYFDKNTNKRCHGNLCYKQIMLQCRHHNVNCPRKFISWILQRNFLFIEKLNFYKRTHIKSIVSGNNVYYKFLSYLICSFTFYIIPKLLLCILLLFVSNFEHTNCILIKSTRLNKQASACRKCQIFDKS